MNETTTTFAGNLTADPDIRFTPTGRAVTHFTVVCTPRRQESDGTWTDGTPVFWPCTAWGPTGEHAAESLRKGDRVLVAGRVRASVWTPTDGANAGVEQKRLEVLVDELGLSLRFGPAKAVRAERTAARPAGAPATAPDPAQSRTTGDPAPAPF